MLISNSYRSIMMPIQCTRSLSVSYLNCSCTDRPRLSNAVLQATNVTYYVGNMPHIKIILIWLVARSLLSEVAR